MTVIEIPNWLACVSVSLLFAYGVVACSLIYRASLGLKGYEALLDDRDRRRDDREDRMRIRQEGKTDRVEARQ